MAVTARVTLRPPLKWAGGKRWQLPYLRPIWSRHAARRLVEPFCGGLGVALGLQPARALLNDSNPYLIAFYRWLKTGLTIDLPMVNDETTFYRHRERFNALLRDGDTDSKETASLFYYLNRTGYNGLCRFSRRGEFNVPFGRYDRIGYDADLTRFAEALHHWEFTCADFEALPIAADDFIYADPPYDVEFRQYGRQGFAWEDQERTARFLAVHPGPVVLANQATRRITRLYRSLGYKVRIVTAPRRISCTGDRTPAREVLATRNL